MVLVRESVIISGHHCTFTTWKLSLSFPHSSSLMHSVCRITRTCSAFDIHWLEVLSEWLSASVCDGKLHRFNPGEFFPAGVAEVPWASLELNSMLYIHIKRKKYGSYSHLYDVEINLSAWPGVNLRPAFAKYCFTRLYTIFYLLLAINIKQHKGVMFSSILLQNDNKFAGL